MDYLACCGRQREPNHEQERPLQSLPEVNANNKETSQEKQNEFFQAIQNMDLERIRCFVDEGFEIKSAKQSPNKKEALHFLAEIEDDAITSEDDFDCIFNILFDAGCQVNGTDMFGNTPLMLAAEKGNRKALKRLLDKRAETGKTNQSGNGPLHWASRNGKKEAVKLLLHYNANINMQNKDHQTPLHLAVINDKKKVVEFLISRGADTNLRDCKNERTPLQYAQTKSMENLFKQSKAPRNLTKKSSPSCKHVEDVVADSKSDDFDQAFIDLYKDIDLKTVEPSTAAKKFSDVHKLDKLSMKDPPEDIVKKCRDFCLRFKQLDRRDIIIELRKYIPAGMTGPLTDDNELVSNLDLSVRRGLTHSLCGEQKWRELANALEIPSGEHGYYGNKDDPAEAVILSCDDKLSMKVLYDALVQCSAAAIADQYL